MRYLTNFGKIGTARPKGWLCPVGQLALKKALPLILLISLGALISGCTAGATNKRYHLSGKVLSIDRDRRTVNVDAQEIPGFMAAMVMPYPVKPPEMLDRLESGDTITADVVVHGNDYWLEQITVQARSKPSAPRQDTQLHIPEPGDMVPGFALVNQDGKRIMLNNYRGKVLLLTFIYTRCPFPDYCPRISNEFATMERTLRAEPALYKKTHLLMVSFDPAHDTSEVLRAYGLSLLGNNGADAFQHWEFAVARAADLPKIAHYFGFFYEEDNGLLTHSLVAAVIAPDGRIFKWHQGNDWHVSDLLKDAAAAVKAG